ncbi:MAG: MFS transporter [Bacillota bacterium]|nr:MAG: MFS transporter [Bacillota bacterium]
MTVESPREAGDRPSADVPAGEGGTGKAYVYTATMGAAHGMTHAYLLFFTPFLKTIQETLGLDWVALGVLVSFVFVAFGLGALPAGVISDFIGHRRAAVVSLAVPAAGCLLGFLADSYWMMAGAFVLIGVGTSVYHPAGSALVSGFAGERFRGRAMGVHGVGGNIGMLLAPVLTAGVVQVPPSWRYAFLLWAALGLATALLVRRGVPETKPRVRASSEAALPVRPPAGDAQAARGAPVPAALKLFSAAVLAVLAIVAIQGFFNDAVFAYLPTFLQDDKGGLTGYSTPHVL